jgi:predicted lipid carrier protein YhbT
MAMRKFTILDIDQINESRIRFLARLTRSYISLSLRRNFLNLCEQKGNMSPTGLPTPLIKGAIHVVPAPVMRHLVGIMVRRVERRHPKLFRNLARLDRATVLVEPTDLPYRFALTVGEPKPSVTLIDEGTNERPDAVVKGPLESLMAMLEARSDGDTLFFARGIVLTGSTAVIVALRNTLDREEIDLFDEIMSFFGPLAKPAGAAVLALDRVARRFRENLSHEG